MFLWTKIASDFRRLDLENARCEPLSHEDLQVLARVENIESISVASDLRSLRTRNLSLCLSRNLTFVLLARAGDPGQD